MNRREFVKGLGLLGGAGFGLLVNGKRAWAGDLHEKEIQAVLDANVADDALPGLVLGTRNSYGTFFGAAGKADLETGRLMTPDTRIRIASITKVFTATLILSLVDEGLLSLDTILGSLLPDSVPNATGITMAQLLNHTAGVYDHENDPGLDILSPTGFIKDWTEEEILAFPKAHGPDFTPGSKWSYSNCGFYLLGMVIEKVTGSTVDIEAWNRIFRPLNMNNTSLSRRGTLKAPYTGGYCLVDGETEFRNMALWNMSWDWTAGSAVTTAGDMLRFSEGLFGGNLLQPQTLQAMSTPVGAAQDISPYAGYGYGLRVRSKDTYYDVPSLGHDGANGGTHAQWVYYPEAQGSLFLATNRLDYSSKGINAVALLKKVRTELAPLISEVPSVPILSW